MPSTDRSVPPGLDALWCLFAYEGTVKNLVLASKATAAHGWLGLMGGALLGPAERPDPASSVVAWATGSAVHRRRRGYDPAERLARAYGRRHGLRVVDLLERRGGPQEGQTLHGRASLRFAPKRAKWSGTVFLVDDVVTSGGTMSQAALALREAGAEVVIGVCFARRELR